MKLYSRSNLSSLQVFKPSKKQQKNIKLRSITKEENKLLSCSKQYKNETNLNGNTLKTNSALSKYYSGDYTGLNISLQVPELCISGGVMEKIQIVEYPLPYWCIHATVIADREGYSAIEQSELMGLLEEKFVTVSSSIPDPCYESVSYLKLTEKQKQNDIDKNCSSQTLFYSDSSAEEYSDLQIPSDDHVLISSTDDDTDLTVNT